MIATPGRLSDLLKRNMIKLKDCDCVVFDEVDRLLESTFNDSLHEIMEYLPKKRQVCMVSSSISHKLVETLKESLANPVVAKVGRPGYIFK